MFNISSWYVTGVMDVHLVQHRRSFYNPVLNQVATGYDAEVGKKIKACIWLVLPYSPFPISKCIVKGLSNTGQRSLKGLSCYLRRSEVPQQSRTNS